MSADLFAEFGSPSSQTSHSQALVSSQSHQHSRPNVLLPDFGSPQSQSHAQPHPGDPALAQPRPADEPLWNQDSTGANVLFDASEPDDDEFGDFEVVEPPAGAVSSPSRWVDTTVAAGAGLQKGKSLLEDDEDDWGMFEGGATDASQTVEVSKSKTGPPRASNPVPEPEEPDDWDAFEDKQGEIVSTVSPQILTTTAMLPTTSIAPPKMTGSHTNPSTITTSKRVVRPTNIPPPMMLLQILPKVFEIILQSPNNNTSPPTSLATDVIRAYTVSARLISGRSLRWKRDTILAQSTKIGPAASGKSGGMKLTSVDKTEGMKEEREAADTIESWSRNSHMLNSILSQANMRRKIIGLSAKLLIRVDRQLGGIISAYSCALCGLKREERLPGVDVDVSDLFGEFWIEYWGHRECLEFWETYKDLLHQR